MTVKETFEAMATRFRPERAQGLQTVIQYDITGPEGCTYHINIADGQCAIREGASATPPALTLTMAGDENPYARHVRSRAEGRRVRFVGRLSHPDTLATIADADVVLMPSRLETFGLPIREAMEARVTVVGRLAFHRVLEAGAGEEDGDAAEERRCRARGKRPFFPCGRHHLRRRGFARSERGGERVSARERRRDQKG